MVQNDTMSIEHSKTDMIAMKETYIGTYIDPTLKLGEKLNVN